MQNPNTYPQSKDVGRFSTQGHRPTMEDISIVKPLGRDPVCLFLAVYDGHSGVETAEYLAENLDQRLAENVETLPNLLPTQLFEKTFMKIETELYDQWVSTGKKPSKDSGSAACVCLINNNTIFVANTGDCRCVISTKDSLVFETLDHKATLPSERNRIEFAGAYVSGARVLGQLAISRAFGDFAFKLKNDIPLKNQAVTAFPDVTVIPKSETEQILILASDGVWDVLSSAMASGMAWNMRQEGAPAYRVAQNIVDNALRGGSKDNVSCIVVYL